MLLSNSNLFIYLFISLYYRLSFYLAIRIVNYNFNYNLEREIIAFILKQRKHFTYEPLFTFPAISADPPTETA